jgi:hypothetical protein
MAKRGDRIVVEAGKVGKPGRSGLIEDVLQAEPPRFLVRWDDGRLSTFSPSSGVARIEEAKAAKTARTTRSAPAKKPAARGGARKKA